MFDSTPRTKLTVAQLDVLERFVGEMLDEGELLGDEADLVEILTNIAEEHLDFANWEKAYEVAGLAPNHFAQMSLSEFKRHYANYSEKN